MLVFFYAFFLRDVMEVRLSPSLIFFVFCVVPSCEMQPRVTQSYFCPSFCCLSDCVIILAIIFSRAGYPIRHKVGWGRMRFYSSSPDEPEGGLAYAFCMSTPKDGHTVSLSFFKNKNRSLRFQRRMVVHIANVTNRFSHTALHSPCVLCMRYDTYHTSSYP